MHINHREEVRERAVDREVCGHTVLYIMKDLSYANYLLCNFIAAPIKAVTPTHTPAMIVNVGVLLFSFSSVVSVGEEREREVGG